MVQNLAGEVPVRVAEAVEGVLPSRARFRREVVEVLGYEGGGRFLVVRGGSVTTLHRRDLTFLPRRSS